MSDDQSFYEIQLNTPHLVLAFLGAAVVGVAIFWLGVVIGRGQGDVGGTPEWQAAVPAENPDDEAAGEDEFGFYEAVEQPATQPQTQQDPATAEDPAATPPTEDPSEAPTFQPADPDPDEPPAGEIVADSGGGMPENDPSLTSGWIIQVRSTPDMASANSLQSALATDGFPAFVVSADVNGVTYYRVRVGRYRTETDARTVSRFLEQRGDIEDEPWVTQG
jgi:cell division protein FtsN